MSNSTTIAKNLGGTLATTVDGDFVESNISVGKSATMLTSGGFVAPANKKKVMSKPFIFNKSRGAASSETLNWIVLSDYISWTYNNPTWTWTTDFYGCPVGNEEIIKNPSVEKIGSYYQNKSMYIGPDYTQDPYSIQTIDYPLWRHYAELEPYISFAGNSTAYTTRVIQPYPHGDAATKWGVGTTFLPIQYTFDVQEGWVSSGASGYTHITATTQEWNTYGLISYPKPIDFHLVYSTKDCSSVGYYSSITQPIYIPALVSSQSCDMHKPYNEYGSSCTHVDVQTDNTFTFYIKNSQSKQISSNSTDLVYGYKLTFNTPNKINYNREFDYNAYYSFIAIHNNYSGSMFDWKLTGTCGPFYYSDGSQCPNPSIDFDYSQYGTTYWGGCPGGCQLFTDDIIYANADPVSREILDMCVLNNEFLVYTETWLGGERSTTHTYGFSSGNIFGEELSGCSTYSSGQCSAGGGYAIRTGCTIEVPTSCPDPAT